MTTSKPLTKAKLAKIERGIDGLSYTGDDVQLLINEIRRLWSVLDTIDASTRHVEAGIDRVAEQNAELLTALEHLDRIIAAYDAPGILPLVNAARAAKAWRGVTPKTVEHVG